MNIFASFRYQMADQKKGILIYYLVILAILLVFGLLLLVPSGVNGGSVFNGLSGVTAIYLFVASLCSFKENFGMALQNGTTRRSLFLGRLCTTGAVCAVVAVADQILTVVASLPRQFLGWNIASQSLFETLYGGALGEPMNPFLLSLCSVAFSFFVMLAASAVGYFITILFYRLNKVGKILVGAGVPCFFFFGVPLLKALGVWFLGGRPAEAVVHFFSGLARFLLDQPQNAMLTYFGTFVAFSAFAWLLMRRAVVK